MVSFVNFARIASICVGFYLGTFHGYFFSLRLLAKFEFPARISNKTCLNLQVLWKIVHQMQCQLKGLHFKTIWNQHNQ